MIAASMLLILLLQAGQGAAAFQVQPGAIAGILHGADGKPIPCVRVTAMPDPKFERDIAPGTTMTSLSRTDESGKFRLENIPPGHYFISAGLVDSPTYYPGSLKIDEGKSVVVESGVLLSGVDFQITATSLQANSNSLSALLQISRSANNTAAMLSLLSSVNALAPRTIALTKVPIDLHVENGKRIPATAGGGATKIWITGTSSATTRFSAWLDDSYVSLPLPLSSQTDEYQVQIDNLPDTYRIRSMAYGSSDLTKTNLKLTASANAICGDLPKVDAQTLSVILDVVPPDSTKGGVTVSGFAAAGEERYVYLSGTPGTFFSDGTFEFRNVPAGRYTLIGLDVSRPPRPLGATIIVGDRDITRIDLNVMPLAFVPKVPAPEGPRPAGALSPGTIASVGSLHGQVISAKSRQPAHAVVSVDGVPILSTGEDGRFDITNVPPGRYEIQFDVFNHFTLRQTVTVGDGDTTIRFEAQPVN
jgi:hypothetical protein